MDAFEKELKEGFLQEAEGLLFDAEECFLKLESLAADPGADRGVLEKIFRLAHSLKGSAGAVGFEDIGHFTHELESLLVKIKNGSIKIEDSVVTLLLKSNDHLRAMVRTLKADMGARVDSTELLQEMRALIDGRTAAPAASEQAAPTAEAPQALEPESILEPAVTETPREEASAPEMPLPRTAPKEGSAAAAATGDEAIRVSLRRLDLLMNNIGELVILQTVLSQQREKIPSPLLQKTIVQLSKITKDIQGISMGLRMIPLTATFQKLNRALRDTSKALGKEIELETEGDETEMDKTVIDHLGDPLVHLIRNAADHGIEKPSERLLAGKSKRGRIRIKAFHRGDRVLIEVSDDGKGLNPDFLRKRALERGLIPAGQEISDQAAKELIFLPGFSTKAESEVSDISGRGIGMDVVKDHVKRLQGEIQIETEIGKGTTFRVILPLTLAIIDAMVISLGDERYVIPTSHIHESLHPSPKDVHTFTNLGQVLSLRGEQLPLFSLVGLLKRPMKPRKPEDSIAIIFRTGPKPFAVLVDDILGQQQVVIKRLGDELQNVPGLSGSSILGDGRAALILDLNELVGSGRKPAPQPALGAA